MCDMCCGKKIIASLISRYVAEKMKKKIISTDKIEFQTFLLADDKEIVVIKRQHVDSVFVHRHKLLRV